MESVFSDVSARVSQTVVEKLNEKFDFSHFIQDICQQFDVIALCNDKFDYTIQGQWNPIAKIHQLITARVYQESVPSVINEDSQLEKQGDRKCFSGIIKQQESDMQIEIANQTSGSSENITSENQLSSMYPKTLDLKNGSVFCTADEDKNQLTIKPREDLSNEFRENYEEVGKELDKVVEGIVENSFAAEQNEYVLDRSIKQEKDQEEQEGYNDSNVALGEYKVSYEKEEADNSCDVGENEANDKKFKSEDLQDCDIGLTDAENQNITMFIVNAFEDYASESKNTRKHTGIKSKKKIFKCSDCDFTAQTYSLLKTHKRNKHKTKAFKCDICSKVFSCKRYLTKHRKRHYNSNSCLQCGKSFKSAMNLKLHKESHHREEEKSAVSCQLCKMSFIDQSSLKEHLSSDHPEVDTEPDSLASGGREIKDDGLKDGSLGPKNTEKGNIDRDIELPKMSLGGSKVTINFVGNHLEFICPEMHCSYKTNKRDSLRHHYIVVHRGKPTNCTVCGKLFRSERYMRKHRVLHFTALHLCDICGKSYKEQKALRKHKQIHEEGYEIPEYQCEYCDKKYITKYGYENHIRVEHFGEFRKGGLCSICGKDFVSKSRLAEHFNTHTGIKPHRCDICHKSFIYASCLRSHKWTHENKIYPCEKCPKVFKLKRSMITHMKKHDERKTYICNQCGKNFAEKATLKRHELIHSGVKPFCCKLCGQKFNQGSIIRRHLSIVHKLDKPKETWREDVHIIKEDPSN